MGEKAALGMYFYLADGVAKVVRQTYTQAGPSPAVIAVLSDRNDTQLLQLIVGQVWPGQLLLRGVVHLRRMEDQTALWGDELAAS